MSEILNIFEELLLEQDAKLLLLRNAISERTPITIDYRSEDDEVLNGLIEYHKNNEEYKFKSDDAGWNLKDKWSLDVHINFNSQNNLNILTSTRPFNGG